MTILRRRNFLAGLGLGLGTPLLGALCRQLAPEALGQPVNRKRIVIYVNQLGIGAGFMPKAAPAGGVDLGPGFAPLAPYRDEVLILNRLHNPFGQNLHGNAWPLSVMKGIGGGGPGGPSLDRLLARTVGSDAAHPSLNLAPIWTESFSGFSADGPGQRFPVEANPFKAYQAVFGAGGALGASMSPETRLARERSLLDLLRADVTRLRTRLADEERAKLDQYLDSIRGAESRLQKVAGAAAACGQGAPDAGINRTPKQADPAIIDAQMAVATAALTCGLTRVVTIACSANYFQQGLYPFLGENGSINGHDMWHGAGTTAMHTKLYAFHAANVAAMRARLGEVREGNGTMADGTLFLMMNEAGGTHHNGFNDHFLLMLGSLRGHFRTGRFVQYPAKDRCISDAFVSIAQAMDAKIATFGDEAACRGPLPDLL